MATQDNTTHVVSTSSSPRAGATNAQSQTACSERFSSFKKNFGKILKNLTFSKLVFNIFTFFGIILTIHVIAWSDNNLVYANCENVYTCSYECTKYVYGTEYVILTSPCDKSGTKYYYSDYCKDDTNSYQSWYCRIEKQAAFFGTCEILILLIIIYIFPVLSYIKYQNYVITNHNRNNVNNQIKGNDKVIKYLGMSILLLSLTAIVLLCWAMTYWEIDQYIYVLHGDYSWGSSILLFILEGFLWVAFLTICCKTL